MGDFNQFPTQQLSKFLDLIPMVDAPTRGNSILDQIFISSHLSDVYNKAVAMPNIGKSDHLLLHFSPKEMNPQIKKAEVKYLFDLRETNVSIFLSILESINWHDFYRSEADLDTKCAFFYSAFEFAMQAIPVNRIEMSPSDPPWMTPLLKHLINCRYEAYRSRKFNIYNHFKTKVKQEIENSKQLWMKKSMKNNQFWRTTRTLTSSSRSNSLNNVLKDFSNSDLAAAAILKNFLCNLRPLSDVGTCNLQTFTCREKMAKVEDNWSPDTSVSTVLKLLSKIKTNKSVGQGNIPPLLLHAARYSIAGPLAHLYSLSIKEASVPLRWKQANVIPIPKKPNATIDDLRPISLLPAESKILETCVVESVKNQLISMYGNNQFGFRPHYSTLHGHIALHDTITLSLDSTDTAGVAIISFDLAKAFDQLSHESLLKTLANSSLPSQFLNWCSNFLLGRQFRVCLNYASSQFNDLTSGVPQGSIISPFLFAAHMGSLMPHSEKNSMFKYADDIIISCPFRKTDDVTTIIKKEVDNISNWCLLHGLKVNVAKSKVMPTCILKTLHFPLPSFELPSVDELRVLGVIFASNLRWDSHIDATCKKANRRLYIIRRLKRFSCISKKDLVKVYNAFILPILEYNSPLFIGVNKRNSDKIEKIRKRCHRIVCGCDCPCSLFPSLSERRLSRALVTFSAMLNPSHLLNSLCPNFLTHSRMRFVQIPFSRTERRLRSFIPKCSLLYNELLR